MSQEARQVALDSESARMEAINRYAILDTPPESAFDRVTRLAAQLLEAPIALINLIDDRRIWIKSMYGLAGLTEVPREPGLCSSAIERDVPHVIEDAARDVRSANNVFVAGPLGIRFYVGVPLVTNDGFAIGTLCVLDRKPRRADPSKVEMLGELAEIVVDELELRLAARRLIHEASLRASAEAKEAIAARFSLTDELTGLANRRALERDLNRRFDAVERCLAYDGAICVLDLDGLKGINDRHGHSVGDALLRAFADALSAAFPGQLLFRYGGDEFVIVFETALEAMQARRNVSGAVRAVRACGFEEFDASFGVAAFGECGGSPRDALRLADARMYTSKLSRR
jgi:diguanylate cyclase (GGDEF)-like protein